MSTPSLDTRRLRARRAELGLSARAVAAEAGLTGSGYVALENGDVPTQPSNAERVAMGVLVNAGLVAFAEAPAKAAEAPMVLSGDVRFSLMLDEDPPETGAKPASRRRSPVTVSSKG